MKDLATHTPGTVVAPGTILMTIVPVGEKLRAEVWVSNDDIGWVHTAQPARIKLASFQFQKYGMLEGTVAQVSADSTEAPNPNTRSGSLAGRDRPVGALAFRTLIDLEQQQLESDGQRYSLAPGMQVIAEIHLGERSVLEYLLSPVRKAFHEAGARTLEGGGGLTAMAQYNPPDPAKIDADNPEALRFWARTLETKEDKIRQAVRKVGPMLEQVKTGARHRRRG